MITFPAKIVASVSSGDSTKQTRPPSCAAGAGTRGRSGAGPVQAPKWLSIFCLTRAASIRPETRTAAFAGR